MGMDKEMTIWGVGLKFTLISALYFVVVLVIHVVWFPFFVIQGIPYAVLLFFGLLLIAIGVPIWITAASTVDQAFKEGTLATQGVYGLCRHPIYGNAIFFTIPGILLFFRSWLLLTVPLVMYFTFRVLIAREEDYLQWKFGPAYLDYARSVPLACPAIWKLYRNLWYPAPTGKVAEGVYAIRDKDVNAFLYTDGERTLAIDAGYSAEALRAGLAQLALAPESVSALFLTHSDRDHIGGLEAFPNARIYLSQDEVQLIDGTTPRFAGRYRNAPLEHPYTVLADGEHVNVGAIAVQAIATPGHTTGSMAFLVEGHVLFTGDTLTLQNGLVRPFYRLVNMDTAAQKASIAKLARLENIALLCTAHTGITTKVARAMQFRREEEGG